MTKRVLMIAFHYPPVRGASGTQRTVKFSRYLLDFGWEPIVLTVDPRAYPEVEGGPLSLPLEGVRVIRVGALDTARHLAFRGWYATWMALPDRWVSWALGAVPVGLRLIRRYRPEVIWSTYPIPTAHLIGLILHRLTGIPWVTDFRDSMLDDDYPYGALARWSHRWIETRTVAHSAHLVFTAPSTLKMYQARYPTLSPERCLLLPNGYDEADFKDIASPATRRPIGDRAVRVLHSGHIYQKERDPRALFRAISRLKNEGQVGRDLLQVDLRAPGSEGYYREMIGQLGIEDLVTLLPGLPYRQSLQDCADSDALLLLQGASCNHQIPAKVYEYLRIGKPILALTSQNSDTAEVLAGTGGATIIDLGDEKGIYQGLPGFLTSVRSCAHPVPDPDRILRYSRREQTAQLASCLTQEAGRRLGPQT